MSSPPPWATAALIGLALLTPGCRPDASSQGSPSGGNATAPGSATPLQAVDGDGASPEAGPSHGPAGPILLAPKEPMGLGRGEFEADVRSLIAIIPRPSAAEATEFLRKKGEDGKPLELHSIGEGVKSAARLDAALRVFLMFDTAADIFGPADGGEDFEDLAADLVSGPEEKVTASLQAGRLDELGGWMAQQYALADLLSSESEMEKFVLDGAKGRTTEAVHALEVSTYLTKRTKLADRAKQRYEELVSSLPAGWYRSAEAARAGTVGDSPAGESGDALERKVVSFVKIVPRFTGPEAEKILEDMAGRGIVDRTVEEGARTASLADAYLRTTILTSVLATLSEPGSDFLDSPFGKIAEQIVDIKENDFISMLLEERFDELRARLARLLAISMLLSTEAPAEEETLKAFAKWLDADKLALYRSQCHSVADLAGRNYKRLVGRLPSDWKERVHGGR